MNNLFETSNYPEKEPEILLAGKFWAWVRPDVTAVYPTANYTLRYVFIDPSNASNTKTVTASKTDAKHVIEVGSSVSETFAGSEYLVSVEVVRDSDSEPVVIEELSIEVRSGSSGEYSHVYKVLIAVRALIEGKATQDNKATTINGKSLERFAPEEWKNLEKEYSAKWEREKTKLAVANGKSSKNRTRIRMSA